jgi:hypothetical protein
MLARFVKVSAQFDFRPLSALGSGLWMAESQKLWS